MHLVYVMQAEGTDVPRSPISTLQANDGDWGAFPGTLTSPGCPGCGNLTLVAPFSTHIAAWPCHMPQCQQDGGPCCSAVIARFQPCKAFIGFDTHLPVTGATDTGSANPQPAPTPAAEEQTNGATTEEATDGAAVDEATGAAVDEATGAAAEGAANSAAAEEPANGVVRPYSGISDADRRRVQYWRLAKGAAAGGITLQPGWYMQKKIQGGGGWHVTSPQGKFFKSIGKALEAMGVTGSLLPPLPISVTKEDLAEARLMEERYGSSEKVQYCRMQPPANALNY